MDRFAIKATFRKIGNLGMVKLGDGQNPLKNPISIPPNTIKTHQPLFSGVLRAQVQKDTAAGM